MSTKIPNLDKLATLPEMHYLLLEVLDRPDPISWYDLSFSCKEISFNFAFTFENTIQLLQLLELIQVSDDKSVRRRDAEDYSALKQEPALGIFMIRKALAYLRQHNLLNVVFPKRELIADLPDGQVAIDIGAIPVNYLLIRLLLLHFGIAAADKQFPNRLLVSEPYRNYFRKDFLSEVFSIVINETTGGTVTGKRPTFFISYASQDEKYKKELQNHFSGLVHEGSIESWDGCAILPGADWDAEVKKKLEEAHYILFLVSSDFMASQYIKDVELKNAMERHNQNKAKIIPIIVRPCDFKGLPIARYQALPKNALPVIEWPNRDSAYADIVQQIRRMLFPEKN